MVIPLISGHVTISNIWVDLYQHNCTYLKGVIKWTTARSVPFWKNTKQTVNEVTNWPNARVTKAIQELGQPEPHDHTTKIRPRKGESYFTHATSTIIDTHWWENFTHGTRRCARNPIHIYNGTKGRSTISKQSLPKGLQEIQTNQKYLINLLQHEVHKNYLE